MAEILPELIVVSSCSKNFGLYRERVGAVSVVSENKDIADLTLANISNLARGIYSMPPDHGAAIVGHILTNQDLHDLWEAEVKQIRDRLNSIRALFVKKMKENNASQDFSFIGSEKGMFSFLGIDKDQIIRLREEFHIYMVESGRVNLAGVNEINVDRVTKSIIKVL